MRLAFALVSVVMCAVATPAAEPDKVLFVAAPPDHAYGSHMYQFECELLANCVKKNGLDAEVIPRWPPSDLRASELAAVVFYSSPTGSVVLSRTNRDRFRSLMQGDIGLVAVHWATGVGYDDAAQSPALRDEFRATLGGWFRRPPCGIWTGRSELTKAAPQHPIGNGWQPWRIHDEFYLDPVLHPNAQPLLTVEAREKTHVVGWTFRREGGGRAVGITLGHFHHNFARPDFRRILLNSILWSAQREVPPQGSNVDVAAERLELPPEPSGKPES